MNEELEAVCDALDAFADHVTSIIGTEATMTEAIGWHTPALNRKDLTSLPRAIASDLRKADPSINDKDMATLLSDIPRRLQLLQGNTVPQMMNGSNAPNAIGAYVTSFLGMRALLSPLLEWQVIDDPKAMPASLSRRVRSIQAELDQLAPRKDELEIQLSDIKRAHAASESLPIDLQSLAEARKTASEAAQNTEMKLKESSAKAAEIVAISADLKKISAEADGILKQAEEAYRTSTTRGLASAFHQRASRLGWSIVGWLVGLFFALATGGWLGVERVTTLSAALDMPDPKWGVVAMHLVLSIASIGAPIWFAWLATKQIGQRFRLAEDYSFKAAVARAYEGYRREAARIDPAFESRLFESALTRLEEAPLRLIEGSTHGSPWHELVESDAFSKAVAAVSGAGG